MKEALSTVAPLIVAAIVALFYFWLSRDRMKKPILHQQSLDSVLSPALSRAIDEVVVDVNESEVKESNKAWKTDSNPQTSKDNIRSVMYKHELPQRLREFSPESTDQDIEELLQSFELIIQQAASESSARQKIEQDKNLKPT